MTKEVDYYLSALEYLKLGKHDEALSDFKKAIEINADDPELYYKIAELLYDESLFSTFKTIADLLIKALELGISTLSPEIIKDIKDFLWSIYDQTADRMEDSEYSYALNENVLQDQGEEYEMKLNAQEVINDLSKLIAICPDWHFPYFDRGYFRIMYIKDYQGAIEDYNILLKSDPDNSSAYYNRGEGKYHLNDLIGARDDYEKAIALNPKEGKFYDNK